MPATLDVACPNCEKPLKVPATLEGKRVKCKNCNEAFTVRAPAGANAATPAPRGAKAPPAEAAKPAAAPVPVPTPEEKPKSPFLDDDDEGPNAKPMGVIKEADNPRCPHCAKELDPPDAVVCMHCGFNNRTRQKAESKKVWAPEFSDWMGHLGPGIIATLIVIGLIVFDIVAYANMRDWMLDSFLQKDDKNPLTGEVDFFVKPGAFIALIIAVSMIVILPAARFAIRRLAIDYKPEEKVKK